MISEHTPPHTHTRNDVILIVSVKDHKGRSPFSDTNQSENLSSETVRNIFGFHVTAGETSQGTVTGSAEGQTSDWRLMSFYRFYFSLENHSILRHPLNPSSTKP